MKTPISCMLIILFTSFLANAQSYKIVKKEKFGKIGIFAGLIDEKTGEKVIRFKYNDMLKVENRPDLYFVKEDGKWGMINLKGKKVIPLKYDKIFYSNIEGLLTVHRSGTYGVYDLDGKLKVPVSYEKINLLSSESMLVEKDGKFNLVDFKGKKIIPVGFDNYDEYLIEIDPERIVVINNGKKGIFSIYGKEVYPIKLDNVKLNLKQETYGIFKNGKVGLVNFKGKMIIPTEYERIDVFAQTDYYRVKKNGKYGLLDKAGAEIYHCQFDEFYRFKVFEKIFILAEKNEKIGIIDQFGKQLIDFELDDFSQMLIGNKTFFRGKKYGKYGLFNLTGMEVIPFVYQELKSDRHSSEQIIAQKNDLYGVINLSNEVVVPFEYLKYHPNGVNDKSYQKKNGLWYSYIDGIEKQEVEPEIDENGVYMIVSDQPSFPGGEAKMMRFIYDNIKYPPIAKDNNIDGMCVISFIIEKDGKITNAKITRDIGGGCGDEALRVIQLMPDWVAGKHNGEPARVSFNLPVRFKLQ